MTRSSALALALLAGGIHAQWGETRQSPFPTETNSANGVWSLVIDSTTEWGDGAGHYRLERDGTVTWEGTLPFTLYEAAVSDTGVVAGWSWSGTEERHEMVLAVVGPDGTVRYRDARLREKLDEVIPMHTAWTYYPEPLSIDIDPTQSWARFVVREFEPEDHVPRWTLVELETGRVVATRVRPSDELGVFASGLRGWTSVPPLDLFLAEWRVPVDGDSAGIRVGLFDSAGRAVWRLHRDRDHADAETGSPYLAAYREGSQLLEAGDDGTFAIARIATEERVLFRVDRDGNAWGVEEIGREPLELPATAEVAAAEETNAEPDFESLPVVPLEVVARVTLGEHRGPTASLGIRNVALDDRDRAGWLRTAAGGPRTFVRMDLKTGLVDREHALELPEPSAAERIPELSFNGGVLLAWLDGERWLVALSGDYTVFFVLDADTGRLERLSDADGTTVRVVGTRDGGFATAGGSEMSPTVVSRFDPDGELLWQHQPFEHGSLEGLALLDGGRLAALGNIVDEVHFYSLAGEPRGRLDLEDVWGAPPTDLSQITSFEDLETHYVTQLHADGDGFVVTDMSSTPTWRLSPDGTVRAEIVPRYTDGRPVDQPEVFVDSAGKMWTTDGEAMLGLDESGVADRVYGPSEEETALEEDGGIFVDHLGRVLLRDERSAAVHAFDADGTPLFVARMATEDFEDGGFADLYGTVIQVSHDGRLWLERENEVGLIGSRDYVAFERDGTRLGVFDVVTDDGVEENWFFQPNADRRWIVNTERLYLVEGDAEPRRYDRGPDGRWLKLGWPYRAAVAPDGSLALDAESRDAGGDETDCVHLYTPEGEPIRTIFPGVGPHASWNLLHAGDRLLFPAKGTPEWIAVDLLGRALARYALPVDEDAYGRTFVARGGRELWWIGFASRELVRMALPPLEDY